MTVKWKRAGLLAAALSVLVLASVGCAEGEGQFDMERLTSGDGEEQIRVSGSGSVGAAPDQVVVRLGVETMADTASAALSENSQQMERVINALQDAGVPEENIQTQTVQLRPQYTRPEPEPGEPREQQRELVGYIASNVVEAVSDDLGTVGDLLDAAVEAGANQVEGIRFEVTQQTDLLTQAREAAWEDAEQKAQQLADLAGGELGDVISINESTTVPRPVRLEVEEARAAVPIQPGQEEIRVDLQVTWALE